MTLYVGEAITVACYAKNPVTGIVISDADATADFWAPGKNPAKVPADRDPVDNTAAMSWNALVQNDDGTLGAYIAFVDTTGWDAGKWAYRVTLAGAYDSWEYGSFKLEA